MKREIKFRAFWKDTGKPILDFTEEYIIDACNDDVFIVEQFTGLKDKNGVDIYEGDIIKIPDDWDSFGFMAGEVRSIYFFDGCFRFKPKDETKQRGHTLEYVSNEFEIIGNIHDPNPHNLP